MTVLNFHELAEQFCLAAGAPVPALVPQADGTLAFTAHIHDVDVTLTHDPLSHPGHAFVLVVFGPLPHGRELEATRQLLRANLLMLHAQSPAFSLNPLDDQALLQYAYPLVKASGPALLAALTTIVQCALHWRESFLLYPDDVAALPFLAAPQDMLV